MKQRFQNPVQKIIAKKLQKGCGTGLTSKGLGGLEAKAMGPNEKYALTIGVLRSAKRSETSGDSQFRMAVTR